MGNTCKPMTDSFQCMTKPTTIKKKKIQRMHKPPEDVIQGTWSSGQQPGSGYTAIMFLPEAHPALGMDLTQRIFL